MKTKTIESIIDFVQHRAKLADCFQVGIVELPKVRSYNTNCGDCDEDGKKVPSGRAQVKT